MPITTPEQLALAKEVSEHLHEHPEQHYQGDWFAETECGTTACVAGWTAILDGARLVREPFGLADGPTKARIVVGGEPIGVYAQRALGLTNLEAERLFHYEIDNALALSYLDDLIDDCAASALEGGGR